MVRQVCADRNKPDGQFVLPGQLEAVTRFMQDLPIRKVPGIGKVPCLVQQPFSCWMVSDERKMDMPCFQLARTRTSEVYDRWA